MRARSTVRRDQEICTVTFYLNGARVTGDWQRFLIDGVVEPESIEVMELHDEATAPDDLPNDGCGVISIWTRGPAGPP